MFVQGRKMLQKFAIIICIWIYFLCQFSPNKLLNPVHTYLFFFPLILKGSYMY